MKLKILIFVSILFQISCSRNNQFPQILSEKLNVDNVSLNIKQPLKMIETADDSFTEGHKLEGLNELLEFQKEYFERSETFNLADLKMGWLIVRDSVHSSKVTFSVLEKWFDVTGFLMQITGETVYADELEILTLKGIESNHVNREKLISPYIFTKNIDNLFVNIFTPATIKSNHTLGGEVKVELETQYPQSGKILLKFNMTERRYMEINIRIPYWAENASVVVKEVKYLTAPGSYCKIAKKWKEGDLVEIEFPEDKIPEYLK